MRATSGFIRQLIKGIAWDAGRSGSTFVDALNTVAFAKIDDVVKGKVLIGSAAGGTQVTYSLPSSSEYTNGDIVEVYAAISDACDGLLAATPTLDDDALRIALLAQFQPVTRMQSDFRALRV